jgi:hypothetical protein
MLLLCATPARSTPTPPSATPPAESVPDEDILSSAQEIVWPEGALGRQIASDFRRLFTRPFHLRGREWLLPAGLAAGAGVAYALRDEVREEIQESRSESRSDFLQDVRTIGKGGFAPALAGVLALVGTARDSAREKQTALLLAESFAGSAFFATLGSTVLAAERPEDGDSVHFLDTDGHGVSLDTALAASLIAPLERAYFRARPGESGARTFWRRTGRGLLYLLPGLVALQRLDQDKHWLPDVYLGYATGLLVGRTLSAGYDEPRARVRVEASATGIRLRF